MKRSSSETISRGLNEVIRPLPGSVVMYGPFPGSKGECGSDSHVFGLLLPGDGRARMGGALRPVPRSFPRAGRSHNESCGCSAVLSNHLIGPCILLLAEGCEFRRCGGSEVVRPTLRA